MKVQQAPTSSTELFSQVVNFSKPLLSDNTLPSGEKILAHAQEMAGIVAQQTASPMLQSACYLMHAGWYFKNPEEVLNKIFPPELVRLSLEAMQLQKLDMRLSHPIVGGSSKGILSSQAQIEKSRKMLLAFGRDLRSIILLLARVLQNLRFIAAHKEWQQNPERLSAVQVYAREVQKIHAPLANRLGFGQIKWELEDLAFRFLEPVVYKEIATRLHEKRAVRDARMAALKTRLEAALLEAGIAAQVDARSKHIYSIVKKMRNKKLTFERVFDVQAMRILVQDVQQCYEVLDFVHKKFQPIASEYDDYIARPKTNGYQSLHTVVRDDATSPATSTATPIEIQIRTLAMHEHAEKGSAAHWAYKEAGTSANGSADAWGYDQKIAVLRELLDWERSISSPEDLLEDAPQAEYPASSGAANKETSTGAEGTEGAKTSAPEIYVFTPSAEIIELPDGATPVDFAYALHSRVGDRCRGAQVDGHMVALTTKLRSGQTVSIQTAKEGGPSRDWLNPQLGYITTSRARNKVRSWFNAKEADITSTRGKDAVERLLQRKGKTSLAHEELAKGLGFADAQALFLAVGKEDLTIGAIEHYLEPKSSKFAPKLDSEESFKAIKQGGAYKNAAERGNSTVLVAGVSGLLATFARCCRSAPPDEITGYLTQGKGVVVHRSNCRNLLEMSKSNAQRVVEVAWAADSVGKSFLIDVAVFADSRPDLLRDISDVLAREKVVIRQLQHRSQEASAGHKHHPQSQQKSAMGGALAKLLLTLEVPGSSVLPKLLSSMAKVPSVISCNRR